MRFTIRPFNPEDAEQMCALHVRSIREVCAQSYSPEGIEAWASTRSPHKYIKRHAAGESFHVATSPQGQIIGFVSWKGQELTVLYINPDFHGQGIGSALLKKAEEEASSNGTPLQKVTASLNAQSFYEKHGYRKVAEGTFTINGITMPEIIMEKPTA